MSASSQPFLGAPLTTIFTPPASCSEQTPSVWSLCDVSFDIVSCYWSLPTQCYPPSPTIHTWTQGLTYANKYHWSPGVLPSGLQTLHTQSRGGISSVTGCYMNWYLYGYVWCTGSTEGVYVLNSRTATGTFAGVLPQIAVHWEPQDLTLFTPTSAPELPPATLLAYESSVSRSKAAMATSTSATTSSSTQSTQQPQSTQTSSNVPSQSIETAAGLSIGAKAGIGVGVAVAVFALIAAGFVFFLRRKRRRQADQNEQRASGAHNMYPYVDGKSELPAREKRLQELAAERERQEADSRTAAPMPIELPATGRPPQEVSAERNP